MFSGLVTTASLNAKTINTEQIPPITNLAKATLNTKAAEIESKILGITNLATNTFLNTKDTEIENKILDIASLAKNATLNSKNAYIEKHI